MCSAVSLNQLHRHSLCPNRCQKHQEMPRTGTATAAESWTSLKHLYLLSVCVAILADRLQAEAIEDLEDRKTDSAFCNNSIPNKSMWSMFNPHKHIKRKFSKELHSHLCKKWKLFQF